MLDLQQSVASLVLEHPECTEVLQRYGVDYCCQGDRSIEVAAQARQVDVRVLARELSRAIARRHGERQQADFRDLPTEVLVRYIVSRHHHYLRQVLPFLRELAAKVCRVHGVENPKLPELEAAVEDLAQTLLQHLDEEEQSLFPALARERPGSAALTRKLAAMGPDHLWLASRLARVRAASDGYTLPEWACHSYRMLFSELEQLEADVFTHVHLENNVLRPRFVRA